MRWVADFYRKQYDWADWRSRWADFDPSERNPRVDAIRRIAGPDRKRILELGSGTGTTAAALAHAGHDVVAIELLADLAEHTRTLAPRSGAGSLRAIAGDFYSVDPVGPFDVVCYFDGFGIGTDDDQRRLLRRIATWLAPGGLALIDVFAPWYWAAAAGREEEFPPGSGVRYRDGFDATTSRMTERMWREGDEVAAVVQSLRCYRPAELRSIAEGTGLEIGWIEPYADEGYGEAVLLHQAMLYLAILVPG
ncbi:MAG TPA: class I SAM-dependent methyltransferase [Actinomycetota bacterium]|nr:class I SAM-dependent methyltransferase [Actinomycetota bacterium]